MSYLIVFILTALADWLWAEWSDAVAKKRLFYAPIMSALIWLVGGYVTVEYINNLMLIIPAVAGCYVGTFISVYRAKHKTE